MNPNLVAISTIRGGEEPDPPPLSFPTISSKRGIGRLYLAAQAFIQYRSQLTIFSINACIGNPLPQAIRQEFFVVSIERKKSL
jgi:hypothetical protein